jgi:hypothetical protein
MRLGNLRYPEVNEFDACFPRIRMDQVELEVLEWFDDLINSFQNLVVKCEEYELPGTLWEDCSRKWAPPVLWLGRHYLTALKDRQRALKEGAFGLYCMSTYNLCHDWEAVRKTISWGDWGAKELEDETGVQAVTILVCALDGVKVSEVLRAANAFTYGKGQEACDRAIVLGMVEKKGNGYVPGAKMPVCHKQ